MKKETILIRVKINQTKLPNKIHFETQLKTKAFVFKDKTKYNRKKKHKNKVVD
jgi:hypothetical protein